MKIRVSSLKRIIRECLMTENAKSDPVVQAGVEAYLDQRVQSIEMVPDPRVRGTFAVRAKLAAGDTVDFLLSADDYSRSSTAEDVAAALEEVEFTSWPPRSKVASAGSALRGMMGM